MKLVSVFMDVEDPINPLADPAALDLAQLFTDAGVRGSFCITGEKCRSLESRGRTDIIDAFKPHCLGLHTNTHSFHPTTMELLADLPYEQGCQAAYESEQKGFAAFERVFERFPAFWGGAGNTWSPEIADAIKRLGIPAYSYALTEFPNSAVHQFNHVVALPQALSISELDWADDARAARESERVLRKVGEIPQTWLGIFVGHPTKFRHTQYWDLPYNYGRTPPSPEFTEPLPVETFECSKMNLRAFLSKLKTKTEIVGVDDALALPWSFRRASASELDHFNARTAANLRSALGWPIHRKGLSAELIVEKTLALANTAEIGALDR